MVGQPFASALPVRLGRHLLPGSTAPHLSTGTPQRRERTFSSSGISFLTSINRRDCKPISPFRSVLQKKKRVTKLLKATPFQYAQTRPTAKLTCMSHSYF